MCRNLCSATSTVTESHFHHIREVCLYYTIYSWDMQRNQTCKIVDIYHFPSLPQLEKNKACCMMLNKSINLRENLNSKLRDWTTNCEIHDFLLGVSNDAIQERYYTGTKIVGSFYNDAEYSFLFTKITFLNQANDFKCWKVQNIYDRGWEHDNYEDFKDCKTLTPEAEAAFQLNPTVTFLWQACCITRFFASKFGHCPTSPFLGQKIWYF